MRVPIQLLLALLLVGLSACAPADPYADDRDQNTTHAESEEQRLPAGELPGTVPLSLRAEPDSFTGASGSPRLAVANAADLYGNWNSHTVRARLTELASVAVGTAHAQLRQAAAEAAGSDQLGDLRSRARLIAVDLAGNGTRRSAVVVTRERVIGKNLPEEGWRYRVTLARLERRAGDWVISRWSVQP